MQDLFIACVDGLKGFPEVIEAVFPHATVQLCILHMVRHSSVNMSLRKLTKNRGAFPSDEALVKSCKPKTRVHKILHTLRTST